MTFVRHPLFEDDVREVPDASLDDWKAQGWKTVAKGDHPQTTLSAAEEALERQKNEKSGRAAAPVGQGYLPNTPPSRATAPAGGEK